MSHSDPREPAVWPGSDRNCFLARWRWAVPASLAATLAGIWFIHFFTPNAFLDLSQSRQVMYILDAVANGNWACQVNQAGEICRKPPLFTWCGASLAVLCGEVNRLALFLPGGLAVLLTTLLIWHLGRRLFNPWAGYLGALSFALCPMTFRLLYQARTDAVFTAAVFATAVAGFWAWRRGRGWLWFWLAGTVATFGKGPLGLLLGAGGLLAMLWDTWRRSAASPPRYAPPPPDPERPGAARQTVEHLAGIALFLLLGLGWFYWAWRQFGQDLLDVMIFSELVGHAVNWERVGLSPWQTVWKPSSYVITRYAPWIVFALIGLWRVFLRPAAEPWTRRGERYLACLFLLGWVLFSASPHTRPDLVYPLLPPLAVLAGRELERLLRPAGRAWAVPAVAAVCLFALGLSLGYGLAQRRDRGAIQNQGVARLAADLVQRYGPRPPLVYLREPLPHEWGRAEWPDEGVVTWGLQYYLGTMRQHLTYRAGAKTLAGSQHLLVAVHYPDRLRAELPSGVQLYEVMRWPAGEEPSDYRIVIFGNRPPEATP